MCFFKKLPTSRLINLELLEGVSIFYVVDMGIGDSQKTSTKSTFGEELSTNKLIGGGRIRENQNPVYVVYGRPLRERKNFTDVIGCVLKWQGCHYYNWSWLGLWSMTLQTTVLMVNSFKYGNNLMSRWSSPMILWLIIYRFSPRLPDTNIDYNLLTFKCHTTV